MSDATGRRPSYPDALRGDIVDQMHGHAVADPYRWLEDTADPRTEAWSAAQDAIVDHERAGWSHRAALRERLLATHGTGDVGLPRWCGARQFVMRREPDQDHAVLSVIEPDGTSRVLIDPMVIDPAGTTTLDHWAPSAEGDRLAYGMSVGGTEDSRLRVLDVDSGAIVEGPIERARFTSIAWLPGGKSFFYIRHLAPGTPTENGTEPLDAEDARFHRRVYRHDIGTDPDGDRLVFGAEAPRATYFGLDISHDGRWLAVLSSRGTDSRDDLWLADIHDGTEYRFVMIQEGVDASCRPFFGPDGTCYVATNRDAPRWRICSIDIETPDFADWHEIVAEDPIAVLNEVAPLSDVLVVERTRHGVSEVVVFDRTTGVETARVPLPGLGTVPAVRARPEGGHEAWFSYTDFGTPPRVLRYDMTTGAVSEWARPSGDIGDLTVAARQITYRSYDGTAVRMFVLTDGTEAGPRPTILNGYGGFNNPVPAVYSPVIAAWIASGGVYAIASLRGGNEEGEEWHRAGMRENKQNVFDDFAAAADWLVASGITTTARLGILGGSNGGLLVGTALTQHPEKYGAVVCTKPLLDMLRYELFGLGETWNGEYGSVHDPVEFEWLYAYSPYHNVKEGVAYPATLFTVFEGDTRVDTLHARKLCAALQHATSGDAPILIRRELGVGHAGRSVSRAVELAADHLAFLASELF